MGHRKIFKWGNANTHFFLLLNSNSKIYIHSQSSLTTTQSIALGIFFSSTIIFYTFLRFQFLRSTFLFTLLECYPSKRTKQKQHRRPPSSSSLIRQLPSLTRMTDTTASVPTATPAANDDKWSSQMYSKHASFVPALGAPVVQLLAPQPHERILDLGAGDGVLTLDLEKQCQSVVAIDASADMIEAARKNGCRDAQVVDGHDLVDHKELANEQFDAVFSSAGKYFFLMFSTMLTAFWRGYTIVN